MEISKLGIILGIRVEIRKDGGSLEVQNIEKLESPLTVAAISTY